MILRAEALSRFSPLSYCCNLQLVNGHIERTGKSSKERFLVVSAKAIIVLLRNAIF